MDSTGRRDRTRSFVVMTAVWLTYKWRTRVAVVWEFDQNAQEEQPTLFAAP
jgi:hypothetical protein